MKLEEGDVFKCPLFAELTGKMSHTGSGPVVDDKTLEYGQPKAVTAMWMEHGENGWKRSRSDRVELARDDPSRGTAEFVVTKTEMSGGGTAHWPHDIYPDGHGVHAIRLTADGEWDPDGERIFFRQSGCFINLVPAESITKTRKMAMSFGDANQ